MKVARDPAASGPSPSGWTSLMLSYHSGAFAGSEAYAATSARGRSIAISVTTSTGIPQASWAPLRSAARADERAAGDHEERARDEACPHVLALAQDERREEDAPE